MVKLMEIKQIEVGEVKKKSARYNEYYPQKSDIYHKIKYSLECRHF